MQTLSQPQVNQLVRVLEYAKTRVYHPEIHSPFEMIGTNGYVYLSPTPAQIREAAERRARAIEDYDQFKASLDEMLTILKTFDYSTPLDSATVESTVQPKTAVLGDLLAAPDKYEHLGKRDPLEPVEVPQAHGEQVFHD